MIWMRGRLGYATFIRLYSVVLSAFLISSISIASAPAAEKTVIKDASQKSKLLGKHMLSLQWLLFEDGKYGSATVVEKDGLLRLTGDQRSKGKDGGYLKIDGNITEVATSSFKFNGEIKTSVKSINNGKECLRNGPMNFLARGKRKYWRLQEMDSPCSEVTDYVDLYFKK